MLLNAASPQTHVYLSKTILFLLMLLYTAQGMSMPDKSIKNSIQLYNEFNGNISNLLRCAQQHKKIIPVAHRGGMSSGFPENAMITIERTIAHIPAIIEIDIVSSKDGVNFLHHDDSLSRTTTLDGLVIENLWENISNAQLKDNEQIISNSHPIRLEQFIEQVAHRAFIMIDLKSPNDTTNVVQQVIKHNMLSSTIFVAYNTNQAKQIFKVAQQANVAVGLENNQQYQTLKSASLLNKPLIALSGALQKNTEHYLKLIQNSHQILTASYFGKNPIDARIELGEIIDELDGARNNGVNLVVSNRVIPFYNYLHSHDMAMTIALAGLCE